MILGVSSWLRRVSAHPNFYWLASLLITLLGAAFRFANLANPHVLVFDETYYVKDAYTLGLFGFEKQWPDGINPQFESGNVDSFEDTGEYVVHPPFGKWVIWFGIQLFGATSSFGWRFSVALLGTLAIPLLIAVARRLIGNKVFALIAGLLLAIEGLSVVMARTAILDGILAFFVLLAFYFLVRDRQAMAGKLLAAAKQGREVWLSFRPWLLLTALTLGLASSVKWSGVYFLAAFGLWTFITDLFSRVRLGLRSSLALAQAILNALLMLSIAITTYIASWAGWILNQGGWGRKHSENWLESLWSYHQNAYSFHTGLNSEHPYSANALQWIANLRPTAFYYESFDGAQCGWLDSCSIAITALPHPLLWAAGVLAMIWLLVRFVRKLDLNAGIVVVGFLAGWAPWLAYLSRTTFEFYAVVIAPYLLLALTFALHSFWRNGIVQRRIEIREKTIGRFLMLALLLAIFFAPLWMGIPIPYWYWRTMMWFPFWI